LTDRIRPTTPACICGANRTDFSRIDRRRRFYTASILESQRDPERRSTTVRLRRRRPDRGAPLAHRGGQPGGRARRTRGHRRCVRAGRDAARRPVRHSVSYRVCWHPPPTTSGHRPVGRTADRLSVAGRRVCRTVTHVYLSWVFRMGNGVIRNGVTDVGRCGGAGAAKAVEFAVRPARAFPGGFVPGSGFAPSLRFRGVGPSDVRGGRCLSRFRRWAC